VLLIRGQKHCKFLAKLEWKGLKKGWLGHCLIGGEWRRQGVAVESRVARRGLRRKGKIHGPACSLYSRVKQWMKAVQRR
jgi:hypothetical protein